jgi:cytochrome c-type biogenesis protein CcmH/NrfG
MPVITAPYPAAEIRVTAGRRRHHAGWLALLALAALAVTLLGWWPHPGPHAAPAARHVTRPAPLPSRLAVTVNGTGYACTVPVKPKPKH